MHNFGYLPNNDSSTYDCLVTPDFLETFDVPEIYELGYKNQKKGYVIAFSMRRIDSNIYHFGYLFFIMTLFTI